MQDSQVAAGDVPAVVQAVETPVSPTWETWLWVLGGLALAVVAGLVAHAVLFRVLRRVAAQSGSVVLTAMVRRLEAPSRVAMPLLAAQFVVGQAAFESRLLTAARQITVVALIATLTWAVIRVLKVVEDVILVRHPVDVADNLAARRVHTQVKVLSRTAATVVGILGLAAALMTFPQVRQVGASLLASAGIAGIIAGVAARPVLENLLAGVQLAFTEPIRLDDVVVVEGEWGRIEEITPTYVVVKIWDERRLIVPLSYFITHPIVNWTRQSAQLLGTAFIYVDYTVPVQRVREELRRILEASERWDRRGWALQVTDATERTVQLRALMSAKDGPTAFELRCEVREKLIEFIRREFPDSLPRVRIGAEAPPGTDLAGAAA